MAAQVTLVHLTKEQGAPNTQRDMWFTCTTDAGCGGDKPGSSFLKSILWLSNPMASHTMWPATVGRDVEWHKSRACQPVDNVIWINHRIPSHLPNLECTWYYLWLDDATHDITHSDTPGSATMCCQLVHWFIASPRGSSASHLTTDILPQATLFPYQFSVTIPITNKTRCYWEVDTS